MTEVEKRRKFIINVVYFGIVIALCFFFFKYAMGTLFPIIFAFIIASFLQRPKNFIMRKTPIKKGFASTLCVLGLLAVILFFTALIGVRIAQEIGGFVDYIMLQVQNIDSLVNTIENALLNFVSGFPEFLSKTLKENIATLFVEIREWLAGRSSEFTQDIAGTLSGSFSLSWITTPISGVISTARQIPSVIIAAVISIVAACFITADYDFIKKFVKAQLTEQKAKDVSRAISLLKSSLGKMGKAYLSIIFITFIELSIGFYVLRLLNVFSSNYIAIISLAIAIIDIIPVLGTGTVLLPWIAYSLITGNYAMAIGLGIMYASITVIRQIIEPKFVAGQLGLPPFLTISAMYVGLKVFGVLGMFIAPMIIIMLKLLNDEGILHLWKPMKENKAKANAPAIKKKK
ncbi:MAG: sporulation integral membrane protein YtvI [Clostridia bacterium]|nr:sporulation integral membrane protein YtvI [Clostridia bacterium]